MEMEPDTYPSPSEGGFSEVGGATFVYKLRFERGSYARNQNDLGTASGKNGSIAEHDPGFFKKHFQFFQ